MKEPAHRSVSFRAKSFGRFAKQYGITIEMSPYDPYGLVNNATLKESKDFIVSMNRGGRIYSFAVTFMDYRTELPSVDDVLDYLANDAAIYEVYGSKPEAFAKKIQQPLAYAENLLREVNLTVPAFKVFMGPQAYAEFLQITEIL